MVEQKRHEHNEAYGAEQLNAADPRSRLVPRRSLRAADFERSAPLHMIQRNVRHCLMGLLIAVTALATNSSPAAKQQPKYVLKPSDFVLSATLFNGDPPGIKQSQPYVPITYDANIVIGARLEQIAVGKSPWPKGTLLRFLVHSPAMIFGGSGFSGPRFIMIFFTFHTQDKRRVDVIRP